MKILVVSKSKDDFEEIRRWQARPEDWIYVDGEIVFYSHPRSMVVMLPMWYHNPAYAKIHNIKDLIDKTTKGIKL